MDPRDRSAIEELFQKLSQVETQAGPRDSEAEALIRALIARQPAAPYLMAQTIVVQEQALTSAQARIEELERQGAPQRSGGGLFSGIFGGGPSQAPAQSYRHASPQQDHRAGAGPWGGGSAQRSGGGFLAGAAQTAMGVAGGVLLGNAIAGMFGSDPASAGEAGAGNDSGGLDDPAAADAAGDFDTGGGDFDLGEF